MTYTFGSGATVSKSQEVPLLLHEVECLRKLLANYLLSWSQAVATAAASDSHQILEAIWTKRGYDIRLIEIRDQDSGIASTWKLNIQTSLTGDSRVVFGGMISCILGSFATCWGGYQEYPFVIVLQLSQDGTAPQLTLMVYYGATPGDHKALFDNADKHIDLQGHLVNR